MFSTPSPDFSDPGEPEFARFTGTSGRETQVLVAQLEAAQDDYRCWRIRCLQAEAEVRALKSRKSPGEVILHRDTSCSSNHKVKPTQKVQQQCFSHAADAYPNARNVVVRDLQIDERVLREERWEHQEEFETLKKMKEELSAEQEILEKERQACLSAEKELRKIEAANQEEASSHRGDLEETTRLLNERSAEIEAFQDWMKYERMELEQAESAAGVQKDLCREELIEMQKHVDSQHEKLRKLREIKNASQSEIAALQAEIEEHEAVGHERQAEFAEMRRHERKCSFDVEASTEESQSAAAEFIELRAAEDRIADELRASEELQEGFRKKARRSSSDLDVIEAQTSELRREQEEAKQEMRLLCNRPNSARLNAVQVRLQGFNDKSEAQDQQRQQLKQGHLQVNKIQEAMICAIQLKYKHSELVKEVRAVRNNVVVVKNQESVSALMAEGVTKLSQHTEALLSILKGPLASQSTRGPNGAAGAGCSGSSDRTSSPESERPPSLAVPVLEEQGEVTSKPQDEMQEVKRLLQLNRREAAEAKEEMQQQVDDLVQQHDIERLEMESEHDELQEQVQRYQSECSAEGSSPGATVAALREQLLQRDEEMDGLRRMTERMGEIRVQLMREVAGMRQNFEDKLLKLRREVYELEDGVLQDLESQARRSGVPVLADVAVTKFGVPPLEFRFDDSPPCTFERNVATVRSPSKPVPK